MDNIRKRAEKVYKETPMPNMELEKWRRTDVHNVDLGAVRPKPINLENKAEAVPGFLVGPERGKFQAFNLFKHRDIRTFSAKHGERIDINVNAVSDAVWRIAGEVNGQAVVVERTKTRSGFHSLVAEVDVRPHSSLDYYVIADHEADFDFSHRAFKLGERAKLNLHFFWMGSSKSKNWVTIDANGRDAEAAVKGLSLVHGQGHLDIETEQNHFAPNSRSNLLFRSGLKDHARFVYQGLIGIDSKAAYSEATQENRNVLLSSSSRADSIPALEINAESVKCTHSVATGAIDDEQVYYLTSRGLDSKTARKTIVQGMMGDVVGSFLNHTGGEVSAKLEEFLREN